MTSQVSLETAAADLQGLLAQLTLGETITLADAEGKPLALLVSLQTKAAREQAIADWRARAEALAKDVAAAWNSEQTAVETLAEMRR